MDKEIWKNVDKLTQISNLGNVRKIKAKPINKNMYQSVGVNINGNNRSELVHRLVAKCFIPNPENKPQVNHKNGIKSDNRVENLEWCTAKENVNHALDTGLSKRNKRTDTKLHNKSTCYILYKNQPYSTFKKFCESHDLKYNTWNKKDFPILFQGDWIYKNKLIK